MPGITNVATLIEKIDHPYLELYLIDLPQQIEGYRKFISAWVVLTEDYNFLVDVGPTATIPLLVEALANLKISSLDYILLTHIHIDHAGGLGDLLEHFPETKILAHPKSKNYLVEPTALWQGSLKVLGDVALKYGEIKPVPPSSFIQEVPGVTAVATPGHAPHHLAFFHRDLLFAGEAAGLYLETGGGIYLRPATPPRFFLEAAANSIDNMLALCREDTKLCYAHYGWAPEAKKMLALNRRQLYLWKDIIAGVHERLFQKEEEEIVTAAMEELLAGDELVSNLPLLDADIQKRENYFIRNSIKGYLGYLRS